MAEAKKYRIQGLKNPRIVLGAAALLTGLGILTGKGISLQNKSNLEMGNIFKEQVENMSKEVETMQNQLNKYKSRLASLNGNAA